MLLSVCFSEVVYVVCLFQCGCLCCCLSVSVRLFTTSVKRTDNNINNLSVSDRQQHKQPH